MQLMKKSLMIVVGAATVLALLAPAATAQTGAALSLAISNDFVKNITPGSEARLFTITPTYTFQSQAQSAVTPVSGIATVAVTFTCPAGVIVSGPGNIIIPVTPGATTTSAKGPTTSYTLSASRDVPGLKTLQCTVAATTDGLNSQAAGKASVSQTIAFTIDYYGLVSASVDNKINDAGPQKQIPYAIQFTNFGNAKTQVNFEISTPQIGKWNPVAPDPIILESATTAGGTNTGTRIFAIGTPYHNGWNNEETTFTLKMTPVSAEQPEKIGSVQSASVLARVRGIYVPALEPALMLAGLLGAVMVARARRAE